MTDRPSALTIVELFRNAATSHPRNEAVVDGPVRLSYAELDRRIAALAHRLRSEGVCPGDRIAVLLRDGLAMIELLLASAQLGAILCPLNWRLAPAELRYQVDLLKPVRSFVSSRYLDLARQSAPDLEWIVRSDEMERIEKGAAEISDTPIPARDAPLLILFTSGTTGRPKAVVHTQESLAVGAFAYAGHRAMCHRDRTLLSAPLFHVNGLSSLLIALLTGGCLVCAPQPLELDALIGLLVDERISVWNFHPTLTLPLIGQAERSPLPIRLRSISMGAGMHALKVAEAVERLFGAEISFGYGQTEAGGFAVICDVADQRGAPDVLGRPLPQLMTRIVDDADREVPDGTAGELCLRGPSVMQGYWQAPDATRDALAGGWLHTGDMCIRREGGLLHFAGRKKSLIKSGGENVYPAEVERVLRTHPAVADCCVAGVPDERWGEAVKAFVVLAYGEAATAREIADHCRSAIAGYKRPRYVEFIDAVPRDFQHKPLRAILSARPVLAEQSTD